MTKNPNGAPMKNEHMTPPNLASAAEMTRAYAHQHGLTPADLVNMFNIGIFAFTLAGRIPEGAECMTVAHLPDSPTPLTKEQISKLEDFMIGAFEKRFTREQFDHARSLVIAEFAAINAATTALSEASTAKHAPLSGPGMQMVGDLGPEQVLSAEDRERLKTRKFSVSEVAAEEKSSSRELEQWIRRAALCLDIAMPVPAPSTEIISTLTTLAADR